MRLTAVHSRTDARPAVSMLRSQVETKSAFLASKGVDSFVITQSACVSPTMYEVFGVVQG